MSDTSNTADSTDLTQLGGPGALASHGDEPFILSRPEWLAVQVYVEEGRYLPQNKGAMQAWSNLKDDEWLDDFDAIVAHGPTPADTDGLFPKIARHCQEWRTNIFPDSVALANDLVHYNDKVPDTYQGLLDSIATIRQASLQLKSEGDPAKKQALQDSIDGARQDFNDLLDDLAGDATAYAKRAADVSLSISSFAIQTDKDKIALDTIVARLDAKYGNNSDEIRTYIEKGNEWQQARDEAQGEYDRDVIIAATTPTYVWVPFGGLVAAAVVAGIYGDRAVKALHARQDADDEIEKYKGLVARDVKLMEVMFAASRRLHRTQEKLNAALPVIEKIRGGWEAISSDLGRIKQLMTVDIEKATTAVQKVDIKASIKRWAGVASKADAYRVNAYISVQGQPPQVIP